MDADDIQQFQKALAELFLFDLPPDPVQPIEAQSISLLSTNDLNWDTDAIDAQVRALTSPPLSVGLCSLTMREGAADKSLCF